MSPEISFKITPFRKTQIRINIGPEGVELNARADIFGAFPSYYSGSEHARKGFYGRFSVKNFLMGKNLWTL